VSWVHAGAQNSGFAASTTLAATLAHLGTLFPKNRVSDGFNEDAQRNMSRLYTHGLGPCNTELLHLLRDGAEAAQDSGDVSGRRARQQHVSDRVVDHLLALPQQFHYPWSRSAHFC